MGPSPRPRRRLRRRWPRLQLPARRAARRAPVVPAPRAGGRHPAPARDRPPIPRAAERLRRRHSALHGPRRGKWLLLSHGRAGRGRPARRRARPHARARRPDQRRLPGGARVHGVPGQPATSAPPRGGGRATADHAAAVSPPDGGAAGSGRRDARGGGRRVSDAAADAVRSHYEALGELYRAAWGDSLHFAVFQADEERPQAATAMERMLADEAGMRPGQSVLDVGCGTGGPAIAVAAYSGVDVTGIDLVPAHLERARVQAAAQDVGDRTEFVEGDATAMPFPDASFDHVYAIESAYHARDKDRFYSECARVLRPGGAFLGTDWLRAEQASNGRHGEILEGLCEQFAIPSLIDLPTLRRHLTTAGLTADVVEDLADLGDVRRNWDELGVAAWPRLVRAARNAPPNALRRFTEGAKTIADAAASGAFVLGHWRARRPGIAATN